MGDRLTEERSVPKNIEDYISSTHKIIGFLKTGRGKLREKYRLQQEKLRAAENQTRAVTKSGKAWRACAEAAEQEMKKMGTERR